MWSITALNIHSNLIRQKIFEGRMMWVDIQGW
jgi:hypothetical protein